MHATPVITVSEKRKVKKEYSGPRTETLMLIRQFARLYDYEPEQKQKVKTSFVN